MFTPSNETTSSSVPHNVLKASMTPGSLIRSLSFLYSYS